MVELFPCKLLKEIDPFESQYLKICLSLIMGY